MDRELTESGGGDRKFAVTVTDEGQCKRTLSIEIPEEEVAREREAVVEGLRRDLKVPGFRKGKVPTAFVIKNYADVIQGDAVRNLLPQVYEEAVQRENLHPLGEPHFENLSAEEGEGIKADAVIEVKPDVEVSGYEDVTVEVESRKEIGESDVQSTLNDLRERLATFEPVDREAQSTDYLTIDYAPYLDSGEVDEKNLQKNYPVELSSESLFEEFRVGLVGMSPGDETDLDVKYPDDFIDKELQGASKRFHVKVVEVKQKLLPEMDESFAKKVNSEVDSLDALKQRIKDDLVAQENHRYEHEVEEKVIEQLIAHNPFEVPDVMVENYLMSVLEEDRRRRPKVPDETERAREVRELFHGAAVRSIKKYFVMDAVKRQENLTVSDEDFDARVAAMAKDAGRPLDEVKEYLSHPERRRGFETDLLDRKVMEFLRGKARVKDAK